MAELSSSPAAVEVPLLTESPEASPAPPWSAVWHVPVLLAGLVLFGAGLMLAIHSRTPPDPAAYLSSAGAYLKAGQLDTAYEQLKAAHSLLTEAPASLRGQYAMLNADYMVLRQQQNQWNAPENHQAIVGQYAMAQELGQSLDAVRLERWAKSYVALGRDQDALAVMDQGKGDEVAERRLLVVRELIDLRRQEVPADPAKLTPLFDRFEQELARLRQPAMQRSHRIWFTQVQMQGLMADGQPGAMVDQLLVAMVKLSNDGGDRDLGPLDLLLAQGYHTMDNLGKAGLSYRLALQKLDATDRAKDEMVAQALVGLGQIGLTDAGRTGQTEALQQALEVFTTVTARFPSTTAWFDAMLGRVDCLTRLSQFSQAVDDLNSVVARVDAKPLGAMARRDKVMALVNDSHSQFMARGDYEKALQYLQTLDPLFPERRPEDLVVQLAYTHERLAEQQQADALELAGPGGPLAEVEPGDEAKKRRAIAASQLFQSAATHFRLSADFHHAHARDLINRDPAAAGQSLWQAAGNYDRAQLWKEAIAVYLEYKAARPNDPLRLRAIRQLGLAYQADHQYPQAIEQFRELFDSFPRSPETYASLVPMAQCYIRLQQPDAARKVLGFVLGNHEAIRPESLWYRQALVELGKLHYDQKEYEQAITRLNEAVERYAGQDLDVMLVFSLADAYRQSAMQLKTALQDAMPQNTRQAMQAELSRRLDLSQSLYSRVVQQDQTQDRTRTDLEQIAIRNAYFYRGDCAYDLGRYTQAIALYDQAATRWEKHPASLIALVQIVNANCELKQFQQARVANERAKAHFRRLPREAFNDPSLPMNRQHWEDWYRWTSELNLFQDRATASAE